MLLQSRYFLSQTTPSLPSAKSKFLRSPFTLNEAVGTRIGGECRVVRAHRRPTLQPTPWTHPLIPRRLPDCSNFFFPLSPFKEMESHVIAHQKPDRQSRIGSKWGFGASVYDIILGTTNLHVSPASRQPVRFTNFFTVKELFRTLPGRDGFSLRIDHGLSVRPFLLVFLWAIGTPMACQTIVFRACLVLLCKLDIVILMGEAFFQNTNST